jgi:LacI family transcriptional regulator
MSSQRQVLLLANPGQAVVRDFMKGAARYLRSRPDWDIIPAWPPNKMWDLDRSLRPDGIVSFPETPEQTAKLNRVGLPVVGAGWQYQNSKLPWVTWDNKECGRVAARHLLDRGLRHFAIVARDSFGDYSRDRTAGFLEVVMANKMQCHPFDFQKLPRRTHWRTMERLLGEWLLSLPKPVGIMADIDATALDLLVAARWSKILIPSEVAVISVGGDDALCELAFPSLSSVLLPGQTAGWEAAALLDRIMNGGKPEHRLRLLPPEGVAQRVSTDVLAVEDPMVRKAIQYMQNHAHRCFELSELVAVVPISRRSLEIRFKKWIGRTMQEELSRVRVARAVNLLRETNLPIVEIAELCGFREVQRLTEVFSRVTGLPPGKFRRQARTGHE